MFTVISLNIEHTGMLTIKPLERNEIRTLRHAYCMTCSRFKTDNISQLKPRKLSNVTKGFRYEKIFSVNLING